jgi:branched-chain amino acid transport system permease protein
VSSITSATGRRLATPVVATIVIALIALGLEGSLSPYNVDLLTTILLYATIAMAWNVLGGYGGMFSLGSSAFVGTGAYAAGIAMVHWGFGYLPALVAAAAISIALAVLLSVPLLRLRGDYFTIGTLAVTLALQAFITNWSYAGQSVGLTLPQEKLPLPDVLYNVAVVMAGLALVVSILVARSSFGLRLMAVRDDQDAASALGVAAFRHRLTALIAFGAVTGLAGGLVAMQQLAIEPTGTFGISWTLNAVLMCVIGGLGTLTGPWVGTIIVYYLITKQLETYQTVSLLIEGVLLIVIVRVAPQGLWPLAVSTWRRFGPARRPQVEGPALATAGEQVLTPVTPSAVTATGPPHIAATADVRSPASIPPEKETP